MNPLFSKSKPLFKLFYALSLLKSYTDIIVDRLCAFRESANVSPAYRYDYKGYFALKKDGSYRWLDDGVTGKFSYNETTEELKWLSGYFKGFTPKITQYQTGEKTAQITISFSDSYRWECGCNK
jgi:hypothetical protein